MEFPQGTKPPKKTTSFILLTEEDSELVRDKNSGIPKTHMTLNPTNFHYPMQMGDISIALNSGKTFIDLKSKNDDMIRHNLKAISDYPEVKGRLMLLFYIP